MLLSQTPASADATTLPYNPHTHSRRRPKLSLNTTAAASCIPAHLTASSSSSTSTPLSPTTRNTMQNKYLTASTRVPRPVSPESASSESSDDEYQAPVRRGITSSYHPTTPKASFYQRRVMFSETVVVIPRD